jgi:hypothetical protein
LKIVTVYKSGGQYSQEHVGFFMRQCKQHAYGVPIICLDDQVLEHGWPGWWSKMEAFKVPGPVLYLDLSSIPIGSLAPLLQATCDYDFIVTRDFNPQMRLVQSCVMGWRGDMSYLYEKFREGADRYMKEFTEPRWWGDQGFIEKHAHHWVYWQDIFPGMVMSYKKHGICKPNRVACFHGRPKPWEVGYGQFAAA